MSISKRQFDLLQAMGITTWQRRDLSSQNSASVALDDEANNPVQDNNSFPKACAGTSITESSADSDNTEKTAVTTHELINLKILLKHPLFKDVIRCLGASSADVSVVGQQIDLGIFNWQFTESKAIELKHNCLKTPDLDTLAHSPMLKKALWQSIGPFSSI